MRTGPGMRMPLAVLATVCAVGASAQVSCDNGMILAETEQPDLADRICSAADRALDVYAECGVTLPEPVTIRVKQEIAGNCLGLFHCGEGLIDILPPDAISRTIDPDGMYAHIPVLEMFDSIIIHELTHALYDKTPCGAEFTECFVTSEYLAYGLQFDALSEEARAPWLRDFDPDETVKRDAIGLGMLMLRTDRFALSSWAHLNQRDDRCAWIKGILDGTVIFDRPRP